jgi:hydroxyacylglutathione hydrolase
MAQEFRDLLDLHAVVDPIYDQNCYVLHRRDTEMALLVDPGLQHAATLEHLERKGLRCERILATHGHGDHVSGIPAIMAAHRCAAAIHPADRPLLAMASMLPGIPADLPDVRCDDDLIPGDVIRWHGIDIAVSPTPGHTPGSVSFVIGEDVFAGDTLFRRSVGRTDLPGGDGNALRRSIEDVLYALPVTVVVYPGHGARTTIGEEMEHNPFVVHPRHR